MNENNEMAPNSKGRKIFRILALFLLVVALPAGSWYYLRSGLNWRIDAKSELGAYGTIPNYNLILPGNNKLNLIDQSVCVIHAFEDKPDLSPENKSIMDEANKLAENFGLMQGQSVRHNFKLILIASNGTAEFRSYYQKFPTSDNATWIWMPSSANWRNIISSGYQQYCDKNKLNPKGRYFALTDTAGTILRYYDALDAGEIGRMVEHISMTLPKEGGR
jgi:hypothetical protein